MKLVIIIDGIIYSMESADANSGFPTVIHDTPFGVCISTAPEIPAILEDVANHGKVGQAIWSVLQACLITPDGEVKAMSMTKTAEGASFIRFSKRAVSGEPFVIPPDDLSVSVLRHVVSRVGPEATMAAVSKILGYPNRIITTKLSDVVERAKRCTTHKTFNVGSYQLETSPVTVIGKGQ